MNTINQLPEVRVHKSFHGWQATTEIDLGGKKILKITTMRNNVNQLNSRAAVHIDEGNGMMSHRMFTDFSKVVESSLPSRVLQKTVEVQHIGALSHVEALKKEIEEHYKALAAKGE